MEQAILNLQHLTKSFDGKKILDDLSIDIGSNECVTLLGPSGCGKTTLLRLLAGLERPDSGRMIGLEQKRISYVFQEHRLFPWMTVEENIACVLPRNKKAAAGKAALFLSERTCYGTSISTEWIQHRLGHLFWRHPRGGRGGL